MCGLCGEIRFDNQYPSAIAIERMNDIMIPRGPDGVGSFQMNHLAFGQRRLKIIDLSDHAHQPMIDNQLGLGIVYNGAAIIVIFKVEYSIVGDGITQGNASDDLP